MGDYATKNFPQMDLDALWYEVDEDRNGLLNRKECKVFMARLKEAVSPDRKEFYKEENFEQLFDKYDEDQNGYIEKAEMAVFVKKVFKKPKSELAKESVKQKPVNQRSLADLLGNYN